MSFYSLSLIYYSIKGSPYVPTKNKAMIDMFNQIKFSKNKKFLELGSGDGRISRYIASKYGLFTTGVDVNILLIWWSRFLAKIQKLDKMTYFKKENIFKTDFKEYGYLYIFLMPELIKKLESKLKKELEKGTIVISHGFPIEDLKKKQFKVLTRLPFPTYYYKM